MSIQRLITTRSSDEPSFSPLWWLGIIPLSILIGFVLVEVPEGVWLLPCVAAVLGCLAAPRIGRIALLILLLLTPWFNPSLGSVGLGRLYLSHLLVGAMAVAAAGCAASHRLVRSYFVPVILCLAYILLIGVVRVGLRLDDVAWAFKPLQPFLVTAATFVLVSAYESENQFQGWYRLILISGLLGCGLAVIHSIVPAFDPFALSRPVDAVNATIGPFQRASGGFVYANNLGTFAAYAAIFGLSALLLRRPPLTLLPTTALIGAAGAAVLLSASRAAAFGVLIGVLVLSFGLNLARTIKVITAACLAGLVVIQFALLTPSLSYVLSERVTTATQSALSTRIVGWQDAIHTFLGSPWVGTGIVQSLLDNSWFFYLSVGGLLGFTLLILLAKELWLPLFSKTAWARLPAIGIILAIVTTGFLQDTLGQTITSWYPGVILGLFLARERRVRPNDAQGVASSERVGHHTLRETPV